MAKNYIQIEIPVLLGDKMEKPATVIIDGVTYAGTVKGAAVVGDVGTIPAGEKSVKWVPDASGTNLTAKVTFP